MANLETLFIEIDGNASQAVNGIHQLAISIASLGQTISRQIGSVKELAGALQQIKTATAGGGNVFQNVTPNSTAIPQIKKATAAVSDLGKATQKVTGFRIPNRDYWGKPIDKDAEGNPLNPNVTFRSGGHIFEPDGNGAYRIANELPKAQSNLKETTATLEKYSKELGNTSVKTKDVAKDTNELAKATKEVGKASSSVHAVHKATSGLMTQIGRIAKTMLIRTAIRSLMKVAKQGLQNFYEYSKSINGTFYNATQSLQMNAAVSGNQIGAAIGSLLTAIAPIANAIISIVNSVANALTMLFSLLGGSTTWAKATTDGMKSIGGAAGGAGKQIKEMLAEFDELNVIASESGGGGGGGGGGSGFGFNYQETPLPDWMVQWKPLLEALLFGGLGALLLPKLIDLLKKLFGGDFFDILKHFFKKDWDFDLPDIDLPDFGDDSDTKTFKIDIKGNAVEQLGLITALAGGAKIAIDKLAEAMDKIKMGFSIWDLLKGILGSVLGGALGALTQNVSIKVDRKAFDDFKKEFEEWKKNAQNILVKIMFEPMSYMIFQVTKTSLDLWAATKETKKIAIQIDMIAYGLVRTSVDAWCKAKATKSINVKIDREAFDNAKKELEAWLKDKPTKQVGLEIDFKDYVAFTLQAAAVEAWTKLPSVKTVAIIFEPKTLATYTALVATIDAWVADKPTKQIKIDISTAYLTSYLAYQLLIDLWVGSTPTKTIKINIFASYRDDFMVFQNAIDLWVGYTPTKFIDINIALSYALYLVYANAVEAWIARKATKYIWFDFTSYYTVFIPYTAAVAAWTSYNAIKYVQISFSNWYSFKLYAQSLQNWANETLYKSVVVEVTETQSTSGTTTTNNTSTGLGFDLWKGITWDNKPVVDIIGDWLGFADGGYGIPSGDLFIANEAGAELVGSINGKTSVANQEQIIEGIQRGVSEANNEQNTLLRQQNDLLRAILDKDNSVRFGASVALGRVAKQSLDMYNAVGG